MKQTLEYQQDEHHVHQIVYHLIWCPRRRKPVVVSKLAERCRQFIEQKCQERNWQILTLAIQPDHLHWFVRGFLSTRAADVVKECKGVTSFSLRKEFSELLKLPSPWTRSTVASMADNISQETIQKSIDAQKG